VFTRPAKTLRPPLAVPPRPGPAPRSSSHLPRPWVTRHQRGFTHVRPSGLPLACLPGWNGSASASSLSSAPRSYPQRTSGRGLTLNTGQELRHRRHAGPPIHKLTRNMPPRVAHPQPSHRLRTSASDSSRSSPPVNVAAAGGEHQRPNGTVLTPAGGHDTPSVVLLSSRPARALSLPRAGHRPVSGSAHSPAATGSESAVWPARYLPLESPQVITSFVVDTPT
jgi:hypothetical protein